MIENFERQDENAKRLKFIYGLITEKCREVLDLWARSYTMEEIRDRLGYKNTQIVMNKKNTCLKRISQQLKKLNELSFTPVVRLSSLLEFYFIENTIQGKIFVDIYNFNHFYFTDSSHCCLLSQLFCQESTVDLAVSSDINTLVGFN